MEHTLASHSSSSSSPIQPERSALEIADRLSTILLIDDDQSVLESVSRVLSSEGHRVVTASSGGDALERISQCPPALVITDLCMGPLTGWDMILHLQNHLPDVPIIVITALAAKSTGGTDLTATAFFQKPLDFDALLAAIRHELPGWATTR